MNFKVEPISSRLAFNPDTSKLFSSEVHGDPYTPMVRAYLGDTVVFRLLQTMANETMVWTLSGHTYLTERYAGDANRKKFHPHRHCRAVRPRRAPGRGPAAAPGDYIHLNGRVSKFSEGAWGIMRVLDKEVPDLQKLPAGYSRRNEIPKPLGGLPCRCSGEGLQRGRDGLSGDEVESNAPDVIEVDFERTIKMVNPEAKIYTLEEEASQVASGMQPMPLTLRANVGDCIKVKLTNRMKRPGCVLCHQPGLRSQRFFGANVGNNPGDQTVGPGRIGPTPILQTRSLARRPLSSGIGAILW